MRLSRVLMISFLHVRKIIQDKYASLQVLGRQSLFVIVICLAVIIPVSEAQALCEPVESGNMHPGDCQALNQFYTALGGGPNWRYPWPDGPDCNHSDIVCEGTLASLERRVIGLGIDRDSDNVVGELPGGAIGALTQLESLNLQLNSISGAIPSQLAGLTHLRYLNLLGNQLTGRIPEGLLGDQATLTGSQRAVIDLSYNQLSGNLPQSLGFDQVNELHVKNNPDLTGPIPNEYLQYQEMTILNITITDICEPQDQPMQDWLNGLPHYHPNFNISSCDSTTVPTLPSVPQNLTASDGTSDINVIVKWTQRLPPPTPPDYYIVERSIEGTTWGFLYKVRHVLESTVKYYDKSAVPPKEYFYRVKACYNTGQCSGYSNADTGYKNLKTPEPLTYEMLKDDKGRRMFRYTWPKITDAHFYEVFAAEEPGFFPYYREDKFTLMNNNVFYNEFSRTELEFNEPRFKKFTEHAVAVKACANSKGYQEGNIVCGQAALYNHSPPPNVAALINLLLKRWNKVVE